MNLDLSEASSKSSDSSNIRRREERRHVVSLSRSKEVNTGEMTNTAVEKLAPIHEGRYLFFSLLNPPTRPPPVPSSDDSWRARPSQEHNIGVAYTRFSFPGL